MKNCQLTIKQTTLSEIQTFTKHLFSNQVFKFRNAEVNTENFSQSSVFNFLKLINKEFDQLAERILKYTMVYATSKFDE